MHIEEALSEYLGTCAGLTALVGLESTPETCPKVALSLR